MSKRQLIQINGSGRLYAPIGMEDAPRNIGDLSDSGERGVVRIIKSLIETPEVIKIVFEGEGQTPLNFYSRDTATSEMLNELTAHRGKNKRCAVVLHTMPYGTLPQDDLRERFGEYNTD